MTPGTDKGQLIALNSYDKGVLFNYIVREVVNILLIYYVML